MIERKITQSPEVPKKKMLIPKYFIKHNQDDTLQLIKMYTSHSNPNFDLPGPILTQEGSCLPNW